MALLYEVSLALESAADAEFESWLEAHIQEILALDGFLSAKYWRSTAPGSKAGETNWTIQYKLEDKAAFDSYEAQHAPRLREEDKRRFGSRWVRPPERRIVELED